MRSRHNRVLRLIEGQTGVDLEDFLPQGTYFEPCLELKYGHDRKFACPVYVNIYGLLQIFINYFACVHG